MRSRTQMAEKLKYSSARMLSATEPPRLRLTFLGT